MIRTPSSANFIYQFIYQLLYRKYENKEKEARNDPPLKKVEKKEVAQRTGFELMTNGIVVYGTTPAPKINCSGPSLITFDF